MSEDRPPSGGRPPEPPTEPLAGGPPPDDTLIQRPVERVVREEQVVLPPDEVVLPPDDVLLPGAVHEEERVGVRRDGSVVREYDRVEQPPVVGRRDWRPWLISGLLLLIIIGFGIWYFLRDDQATVPSVVGQPVTSAISRVEQAGFKTQVVQRAGGSRPGVVLAEQPAAGTHADKGSTVTLTVSSAPATVTVPNAVGLPEATARDRLVAAGFKVTSVQVFSSQPSGVVVAQAPAAGEKVAKGAAVRINVSKGSATANVPNELGQPAATAQKDLASKGFKPVVVQVPSDQPAGTVVAQAPPGGQARKGSTVRLNVSSGPATSTSTTTTTTATTTVTTPTDTVPTSTVSAPTTTSTTP